MRTLREVAFLFIGGPHQVFHLAPVAAEFSKIATEARVVCLYSDPRTRAALEQVTLAMPGSHMAIERIELPAWAKVASALLRRRSLRKIPELMAVSRRLRGTHAIVTPERTSAALRHLGHRDTLMIHFRHGAGDRLVRSEKRLRSFDLIAVHGEKYVHRAMNQHGIPAERLRVAGYVKLDFLTMLAARRRQLFPNDRPIILYNPHFERGQSSWQDARAIIEAVRSDGRYNLIVAPHLRLAENMPAQEIAFWKSFEDAERIIVDFDSLRLVDMTYTRAADIYLGDVSSQIYEFLAYPRPVVFFNSHCVAWRDNPHYACWALGEVADDAVGLMCAIDNARENHADVEEAQHQAVLEAFGPFRGAIARGARIIADALEAEQESWVDGSDLAKVAILPQPGQQPA